MLTLSFSVVDIVRVTEIPLLSPFSPPATMSGGQGYFDLAIRPKATFQSLGTGESPRDVLGNEESMQSILDYIAATLDRLQRLVITLQDPTPIDLVGQEVPPNADRDDIELVGRMFPQAAASLVQRLGTANWRRRQYLKEIRLMMERQSHPNKNQIYRYRREFSQMGKFGSRLPEKGFLPLKEPVRASADLQRKFSVYTSSETASHTGTFDFTAGSPTSTVGTSVADSMEMAKTSQLSVPDPPLPLDEGNQFQCPYCAHLMIVGKDIMTKDVDDWIRHVYADIEPYMCTFASDPKTCIKVEKTFGSREKWFAHELDAHRSNMVWYCQSCVQEFETDNAFGSHVLRSHDRQLDPDQLSLVASLCKRRSEKPWLSDLCPLCNIKIFNAERFRSHLAGHLEQIALTSIQSETDEPVSASPTYPTTPSDYSYRSNLPMIDQFVSEGHRRLVATGRDSQGRVLHGLDKVHMDGRRVLNFQKDTIFPQNSAGALAGTRPKLTPRRSSYAYLEEARNLKNTMTGQRSPSQDQSSLQAMAPHAASPSHICTRTLAPPKNQDFVGRRNDLAKVHHELEQKGSICILSGVGGLGKSALAVEYTYLFEPGYDFIFWVQAETPMRCAEAYSQIALVCVPDTDPTQEQDRLVMLSREFLEQTPKRWLLVFDNVDHWRNLQNFLPERMSSTSGSVLITANTVDTSSFTPDMRHTTINLGTLGLDESRSLLLKATSLQFQGDIRDHPEYKLAGDVARMAERLPLALSLIAGYMLVSNLTLTQFVELWNERPMNVPSDSDGADQRNMDPDTAMDNVWSIGLREVSSDGRELLNILAFFDSDNIQKELLIGAHTNPLLEVLHSSGVAR